MQIYAEPSHPHLWLAKSPQSDITSFAWPNMYIIGAKQRCIVAMDFLKQNVLLSIKTG
jgi:hypothetical protein